MFDIIIIGSGISGLYAGANIPKDKKCLIITKGMPWQGNSFYAQGGIATAIDESDIDLHISDTMKAGDNYCSLEALKILSKNSLIVIKDIINRGFEFDKDEYGNLAYTKEGAHSIKRILHADGDATGRMLHKFLMEQNEHPIANNFIVTDLLIKDNICYGVEVLDNNKLKHIYAKCVIIATGGIGSLYKYSTNEKTISGDLQGICLDKGIELIDMELIQFHPSAYISKDNKANLLSEALRGEGALIVDDFNRRFLFDYDKKGELAPRDVVSRAIFDYKQKSNSKVYLSFENFNESFFKTRFPNIYYNLNEFGFNVPKDKIEISPAYHYSMGGIKTDLNAKVINFSNLYAIGEVACTRVHGANRLASNSLLEGLVFSKIAIEDILCKNFDFKMVKFTLQTKQLIKKGDEKIEKELKDLMWNYVGIVRYKDKLEFSLNEINKFLASEIGEFLRFKLLTAKNIVESAIKREESLGAHYIIKG